MPPPPASGDGPSGPRAGFGQRLGAWLIDVIIIAVVQGVVMVFTNQSVASGVGLLFSVGYYTYLEGGATGQTLGKRVLNIRVIDYASGGPLGYGKAFIRWLGRILSSIPLGLGYFWMLWDREKQTWHDKIASTVVVPTSAYPVEGSAA